jgi:hypothetical protein
MASCQFDLDLIKGEKARKRNARTVSKFTLSVIFEDDEGVTAEAKITCRLASLRQVNVLLYEKKAIALSKLEDPAGIIRVTSSGKVCQTGSGDVLMSYNTSDPKNGAIVTAKGDVEITDLNGSVELDKIAIGVMKRLRPRDEKEESPAKKSKQVAVFTHADLDAADALLAMSS